jgi:hypothetical protein
MQRRTLEVGDELETEFNELHEDERIEASRTFWAYPTIRVAVGKWEGLPLERSTALASLDKGVAV